MKVVVVIAAVAMGSASMLLAASASADDDDAKPTPSTTTPGGVETTRSSGTEIEIGGQAAYTTVPIRGGTTPFGTGFGGRLGLVLWGGFYAGIGVLYYLGGTDVDIKDSAILYGLDLGYDFRLVDDGAGGRFTLRPQLGVGGVRVLHTDPSSSSASTSPTSSRRGGSVDVVSRASGSSSSDTTAIDNYYLRPGLTFMYSRGAPFVAINTNVLVVPGISYGGGAPSTWLSYGAQADIGLKF